MDPNEILRLALEEARKIVTEKRDYDDDGRIITDSMFMDCAENLAEHVAALDGWLAGGGFLPKRWEGVRGNDSALVDCVAEVVEQPLKPHHPPGIKKLAEEVKKGMMKSFVEAAEEFADYILS